MNNAIESKFNERKSKYRLSIFNLYWDWLLFFASVTFKSTFLLASIYQISIYTILTYQIFSIMPLVFVSCFTFLFPRRKHAKVLFYINIFISLIFFTDILYARAFGHLISIHTILAKGVTEDLGWSIVSLIKWTDFLMIIDLPLSFWFISKQSVLNDDVKKRIVNFAFTLLVSVGLMYHQFNDLEDRKNLGNIRLHPLIMSPIGEHFYDFYRFVYERSEVLDQADIEMIDDWLVNNAGLQGPHKDYAYLQGILKGKNLIVVQFESLENCLINKSYMGIEITPNINRMLAHSLYFSNISEQVKDGNSSDAELLFNTSLYPLSSGSAFLRFAENDYNSLPKLLRNYGYTSKAIHGDDKEFWNRYKVFPALGFDQYIAEDDFKIKSFGGMGILDEALFTQAYAEIENLKSPYYLYIITMTSHMPFNALDKTRPSEVFKRDYTTNYIKTISYTDKCLGKFYNQLEEQGMLENTAIIVYGDHEGIHKYYDETKLPDNDLEIPFIVFLPGLDGQEIQKIGGQVDMMPTLAYLLGIEYGQWASTIMGVNLFSESPGSVIRPDGEIRGSVNEIDRLVQSQTIADKIIRGNYFSNQNRVADLHGEPYFKEIEK